VYDASGNARTVSFLIDRPLTAQIGINYAATDTTHILADVGYIAYGSTSGFEHSGFRADGSVAGLGWQDSYTFELGVQQALTSGVTLRVGYNYCSDPIPADMTFFNVGSPLHITQHISAGLSISVAPGTTIDVSYTRGLSHTQSSAWSNPYGTVPGTSFTSTVSGNEFAVGTTFKF
jgi:long-subunit fatty acid transport protein